MSRDIQILIEGEINRYIGSLGGKMQASMGHSRRLHQEAVAYGLGMCKILSLFRPHMPGSEDRSVSLAAELMRAARDIAVEDGWDGKTGHGLRFPSRRAGGRRTMVKKNPTERV